MPDEYQKLVQQGVAELEADRPEPARRCFQTAARLLPRRPLAWYYLALTCERLGQSRRAAMHMKRCIARGGETLDSVSRFAWMLLQIGEAAAALQAAQRALQMNPDDFRAICAMAVALDRSNQVPQAMDMAERAVRLRPEAAESRLLAGRLCRHRGDADDALKHFRVIAEQAAAPPRHRMTAWREIGLLREDQGRFDEAFDAFTAAGRHRSEMAANRRIDRAAFPRMIEQYRAAVTDELLQRWTARDFEDAGRPPGFLVGMPMSGAAIIEQLMTDRGGAVLTNHRPILLRLETRINQTYDGADAAANLARLRYEQIIDLRLQHRRLADRAMRGALRDRPLLDNVPLNIVRLGLISVLFPDSSVIVALRDPRDVCMACFKQHFGATEAMVHLHTLEDIVATYAAVMGLYLHQRARLNLAVLEVRHEDLVADVESKVDAMLHHMGLGGGGGGGATSTAAGDSRRVEEEGEGDDEDDDSDTDTVTDTDTDTDAEHASAAHAVGAWRHYESHLTPHLERLQPFVEALGYEA